MNMDAQTHSVTEMKRAITRFKRPDRESDRDRSRVSLSQAERRKLQTQDREAEIAVEGFLQSKLSEIANIYRCSVFKSDGPRLFVSVYTLTDLERDELLSLKMDELYEAIYATFKATGWFVDGHTKMGVLIDSDETVMRDYGDYYRREH